MKSYSVTFTLPANVLPTLLGRRGSNIAKLRAENNIKIDIFENEKGGDASCSILGDLDACEVVKEMIMSQVEEISSKTEEYLKIPHHLHRVLIGRSGSQIKEIIDSFGGADKVQIRFPKSGIDSDLDLVTVICSPEIHASVKETLYSILLNTVGESFGILSFESAAFKESFAIPKSEIGYISGRNKQQLYDLMKKYGVTINIKAETKAECFLDILGNDGKENSIKECIKEIKVSFPFIIE